MMTRGRGGVTIPPKNDDVIYEQPLSQRIEPEMLCGKIETSVEYKRWGRPNQSCHRNVTITLPSAYVVMTIPDQFIWTQNELFLSSKSIKLKAAGNSTFLDAIASPALTRVDIYIYIYINHPQKTGYNFQELPGTRIQPSRTGTLRYGLYHICLSVFVSHRNFFTEKMFLLCELSFSNLFLRSLDPNDGSFDQC